MFVEWWLRVLDRTFYLDKKNGPFLTEVTTVEELLRIIKYNDLRILLSIYYLSIKHQQFIDYEFVTVMNL